MAWSSPATRAAAATNSSSTVLPLRSALAMRLFRFMPIQNSGVDADPWFAPLLSSSAGSSSADSKRQKQTLRSETNNSYDIILQIS